MTLFLLPDLVFTKDTIDKIRECCNSHSSSCKSMIPVSVRWSRTNDSLMSSQTKFQSNTQMLQILLIARKHKLQKREHSVVFLFILLSSKLCDSARECQTAHCLFLRTSKATFNTITNTHKAFSLTQAAMNLNVK